MKHTLFCLAGLALVGLAAPAAPVAATPNRVIYHVTDLGVLPGGYQSSGAGINAADQVVGTSDKPYGGYGNGTEDGFLYSGGKLTDLGTLPGNFGSFATGINRSGQTAANAFTGGYNADTAFIDSEGKRTVLPKLGAGINTDAYGINDAGQVTGYGTLYPNDNYYQIEHAFLYTNGRTQDLGTLGFGNSIGYAVNNAGEVCGYSNVGINNDIHAFLYTGGKMTDLGSLGGGLSEAYALNDFGSVVGYSTTPTYYSHAFVYIRGKMSDLGTLGGPTGTSYAYGVNATGQIVGVSSAPGDNYTFHGFVYTGGRLYDLNSLLDTPSKADIITNAKGINASGSIVADATINGWTHAVLLTPVSK